MIEIKAEDIVTGAIVEYGRPHADIGIISYDKDNDWFGCYWFESRKGNLSYNPNAHQIKNGDAKIEFSAEAWACDYELASVNPPAKTLDELSMYKMLYPGGEEIFDLVYKTYYRR